MEVEVEVEVVEVAAEITALRESSDLGDFPSGSASAFFQPPGRSGTPPDPTSTYPSPPGDRLCMPPWEATEAVETYRVFIPPANPLAALTILVVHTVLPNWQEELPEKCLHRIFIVLKPGNTEGQASVVGRSRPHESAAHVLVHLLRPCVGVEGLDSIAELRVTERVQISRPEFLCDDGRGLDVGEHDEVPQKVPVLLRCAFAYGDAAR